MRKSYSYMARKDRPARSLCQVLSVAIFLALLGVSSALAMPEKGTPGATPKKINVPEKVVEEKVDPSEARRVIFKIDGEPVTLRDLRVFQKNVHPDSLKPGVPLNIGMIDQMINNRLMAGRAEKEGLAKDPRVRATIETRLNRLWREVYRRHFQKSVKVSDKDLWPRVPTFKENLKIQQIVVDEKATADAVRARALKGEDFTKLVREKSTGFSKRKDGITDGVERGAMPQYGEGVADRFFNMKVGEISEPIKIEIGYVVVKILDRRSTERLRKEFFDKNRNELIDQVRTEAWGKELRRLSDNRSVVIDNGVLAEYQRIVSDGKQVPPDFLEKVAFRIDNVPFTLEVLANPTGVGGAVHGGDPMELLAETRIAEFAVANEVVRLGLDKKNPEVQLSARTIREHILAREYVGYRGRGISVSDSDARAYFDKNKGKYVAKKGYFVSYIETKSEKRLKSIYDDLAKGTEFGKVVENWSDDKSSSKGAPGIVLDADLAPEFAAIRSLKIGEYTKVPCRLKKKDGVERLYVFRLDKVQEARPIKFEEVTRADIDKAVVSWKREDVANSILMELRRDHKVEFTSEFDKYKSEIETYLKKNQGGKS